MRSPFLYKYVTCLCHNGFVVIGKKYYTHTHACMYMAQKVQFEKTCVSVDVDSHPPRQCSYVIACVFAKQFAFMAYTKLQLLFLPSGGALPLLPQL